MGEEGDQGGRVHSEMCALQNPTCFDPKILAIVLARRVFPAPGGPYSKIPFTQQGKLCHSFLTSPPTTSL